MPLNARIPLVPRDALILSDSCAIHSDNERIVFFDPAGPFMTCRPDDTTSIRTAAVIALQNKLVSPATLAEALGMHRTTLYRALKRFEKDGIEGLMPKRRGPKGPSKLTSNLARHAQSLLDQGTSIRATAEDIGLSDRGLRHAIHRGVLDSKATEKPLPEPSPQPESPAVPLTAPVERASADQDCALGTATTRQLDRTMACAGLIHEAKPEFEGAQAVAGAGALIALPALLELGLLEVATSVYGTLRSAFFGLQSVLLTLAFMALLRIKSVEQLTQHAPGELGFLLGLDRVPEVKTLRRKLQELGERMLARVFARELGERWAQASPEHLAILYVDGHVRPYHGRKHELPLQKATQLGRFMPGTKDVYVNDQRSDPLLFVTAEGNESLLRLLDSVILPSIRSLVGAQRRVTIVFDREGWSPELFAKWKEERFDVLTYRKGRKPRWQDRSFEIVSGKVGDEMVQYRLAERELKLRNGLKVREIRRLHENGHQVSVVTTNDEIPLLAVAYRMFSRWKQENFFRYMRQEFALDHLCTNAVEPADPQRVVRHPERVKLEKERRQIRAAKGRLLERRSNLTAGKRTQVGDRWVTAEELDQIIEEHNVTLKVLTDRIQALPQRVSIGEVRPADTLVQLERERKILIDTIKLTAYRAETSLARLLASFFSRHEDEARKLLKTIFQATADICPDRENRLLTVRFHGLANPRATRALSALCELVNEKDTTYPGSDLRLRFEAPMLQQ